MRVQLDRIEKREKFLKLKSEECTRRATLALSQNNRNAARLEIKKRKLYTDQIDQCQNLGFNLVFQITEVEKSIFTKEQLTVMEQGVKAMNSARGKWKIGDVEEMADQLSDTLQTAAEIQNVVTRPFMDVDDDDVDAELDLISAPAPAPQNPPVQFPEVPTHVPVPSRPTEEDEIEELKASMAT
jgi:hypothetical protein